MENNQDNIDLKQNILDKVKSGEVKMTRREFFFLKWTTMLVASIFFGALAVYIFAYVTFLFVDSGILYIPLGHLDNLSTFIIEVPWTLILLGVLSVFLFSITSKTFYRLYKKPFLTFSFSILAIILIMHALFVQSGIMKLIKEGAYSRGIHLVPEKFLQFRDSQTGNLFVGYVISTSTDNFVIEDRRGRILTAILLSDEDKARILDLELHDKVNIFGNLSETEIDVIEFSIVVD